GGERLAVSEPVDACGGPELPEDIPLDILFEDAALLVINKPAGLVVHPGSGNRNGTLMNALLHHVPGIEAIPRAGIVHRLDKDTSGLLVVAKTLAAQTDLVRQLQARTVRRIYLALAAGVVKHSGSVDAPIGRHPAQRVKMAVVPESRGGKAAKTRFRVLETFAHCALLECSLETGRTHQIRVHLASIGHPLVGDPVYGRAKANLPDFPRQALHAARLGLVHPASGQEMLWETPLPPDMSELLETLCRG
ncbi:MAG: RluA family pseudouridine synthase, partial [Azonexus sp.]|nr:RluA family pseudouridine synthase [Azonexus sp.]